MMLLKCSTHYAGKLGKLSSGHRTGKGQSSSQFPRRAVLKNVQTSRQLHSSPMLVRLCSKSFKLGFVVHEFRTFRVQAGFRKGRGTRDQISNICWIMEEAREVRKNIYFCFTDYVKAFDCVDHNKLWRVLKEMGISDYFTYLLKIL